MGKHCSTFLNEMQVQTLLPFNFVECAQNDGMTKPYQDIATRLIEVRKILGLSQADFARGAKIGIPTMANWESGVYRVSLNGALKLRETYGLSLDFMFCGNVEMLPSKIASALRSRPRDINSK